VKIGAENKKQVIIMAVLLLVAASVVVYDFFGSGTSSAAPPAPSASRTADSPRPRPGAQPGAQQTAQNDLDPTFRDDVLEASRKVKYQAGGRNIFRMEEPPPPKPVASVRATPTPFPTPTPTPPPPPIPLKFYGFANKPGEAKKIFLSEGEPQNSTVFIAKQGDIVNRRYKVVQISTTSVQIEDVLYNNKQTIPLTAR
jgi:hypothetical protein